jgi:hypothetical protein
MNSATGSGRTGASDDDRTFLWLILALVVAMVVVGGLALLTGRAAGETAQVVASLGLPGSSVPGGVPAISAPVPTAVP